jgi:hypothetical protein
VFEIGNSLREARHRRRIDFGVAEQATKIRSGYLRALEDEQFEQLPSPTYVKGFLRTYAEYLGLDGQLYVDEYNSRFVAGDDWDGPRRSRARHAQRSRGIETSIVLVALGLIAVVTIVVISAWQFAGGPNAKKPAGSGRSAAAESPGAPIAYLRIEALRGSSYLAVHRNGPSGPIVFQGTLQKGAQEPFSGEHFWMDLSSPENLTLVVGGKFVVLHGLKPESLTVTPKGVRAD